MPAINRTGESFGQLTVVNDAGGSELHCRCSCGREGHYPRAITKPSYRGPRACRWCLGSPCEECGSIIPRKARMPAKTCSPECATTRKNRLESERYERIKHTPEFHAARRDYLERQAAAMKANPALAQAIRETRRRCVSWMRLDACPQR